MLTKNQLEKVSALQKKSLAVGVLFTGIALAGGLTEMSRVFQVFLVSHLLWLGLAVGCLALVMLHHLCGGAWSFLAQRVAEAASRTLPFFIVLGALVVLGGAYVGNLYPWTDAAYREANHIVANKAGFLNLYMFTGCFAAYFALWFLLMWIYNTWSSKLDRTGDARLVVRMKSLAGPGLVLYVISLTFAATHWAMSLEPEWFSTIYGAWLVTNYALTTVAFVTIVISYLAKEGALAEYAHSKHFLHYGNFLLGFTVFWSYISFAQFLIIWNGNIPEEIKWYLNRQGGALTVLTIILMVMVWFAPMLWLMTRGNKTKAERLRKAAYYILATRVLDVYWNLAPSFPDHHSRINWVTAFFTLAAVIGIGGLWLCLFLAQLKKRPLLPQRDPRQGYYFLDSAHDHDAHALGSEAHG